MKTLTWGFEWESQVQQRAGCKWREINKRSSFSVRNRRQKAPQVVCQKGTDLMLTCFMNRVTFAPPEFDVCRTSEARAAYNVCE